MRAVVDDAAHRLPVMGVARLALSEDQVPLLAPLAGFGSRRAKPGSAATWRRWRHAALRVRVAHTVPYGRAPPATPQEREGTTPRPGSSEGSCTPSTSSTPGHGSWRSSR